MRWLASSRDLRTVGDDTYFAPIYLASNSRAQQSGQKNAKVGSRSSSGSSVRDPRQPLADRPLVDPH
jgi:hypothetical protein